MQVRPKIPKIAGTGRTKDSIIAAINPIIIYEETSTCKGRIPNNIIPHILETKDLNTIQATNIVPKHLEIPYSKHGIIREVAPPIPSIHINPITAGIYRIIIDNGVTPNES